MELHLCQSDQALINALKEQAVSLPSMVSMSMMANTSLPFVMRYGPGKSLPILGIAHKQKYPKRLNQGCGAMNFSSFKNCTHTCM